MDLLAKNDSTRWMNEQMKRVNWDLNGLHEGLWWEQFHLMLFLSFLSFSSSCSRVYSGRIYIFSNRPQPQTSPSLRRRLAVERFISKSHLKLLGGVLKWHPGRLCGDVNSQLLSFYSWVILDREISREKEDLQDTTHTMTEYLAGGCWTRSV